MLNIGQSGLQYRIVRLIGGDGQYRYIYDASGLRVAKGTFTGSFPAKNTVCPAAVPGTNVTLTAQYLLNLGGEQVTELNGTGGWVHSNVWAGSHLDATYDTKGLHFQLADPLGTRRVQTNYQGVVEEYVQSLPFGDNLNTVIPSGAPSTADDATEHHFTGKEHDQESGNDYFGARYYASAVGRWLSPDWSSKEEPAPYAKLDDPQALNLYAYVGNNPLTRVDSDGHAAAGSGCRQGAAACGAAIQKSNAEFDKHAKQLGSDVVKLVKSAKVSVEAGVGEQKKGSIGGVKGEAGYSLHAKSTFALGDLSKSTFGVEADGGLCAKVGDKKYGASGSAALEQDMQGNVTPTGEIGAEGHDVGSSLSITGEHESTFGGADYDGVGGGVSVSVSTEALHDVGRDLGSLFGEKAP